MGRKDAGRFLDVLDESFGAAIAAADEVAADDLALSFLQDLELDEALRRSGPIAAQVGKDPFRAVIEVGLDYVVTFDAHPRIIKMDRAVFRVDPLGSAPALVDRTMVTLLRSLARRPMKVRVAGEGDIAEGLMVRAGRDHLGLKSTAPDVLIPLGLVSSITLLEEQSWRL